MVVSDYLQRNTIPSWLLNDDFKKLYSVGAGTSVTFKDIVGICSQSDVLKAFQELKESASTLPADTFHFHEEEDSRYIP